MKKKYKNSMNSMIFYLLAKYTDMHWIKTFNFYRFAFHSQQIEFKTRSQTSAYPFHNIHWV